MLLKFFLMLLSLGFFFSDRAGGAGGDDGNDQDDSDDDAGDDSDDGTSDDDDDGDKDDLAELREALRKELREARRHNRQMRRESREGTGGAGKGGSNDKGGKGGDDSDDDGGEWKTRFEELDRRYRTETVRNRVSAEAGKRNAIDPAAVARLVELDDVVFDDKGAITNLGDLMDELIEDFPRLFRKSPGKGNGGDEHGRRPKVKPGLDRLTAAYATESTTKNA